MTPEFRRERQLLTFARLHDAAVSSDEATRLSIASLCRAIVDDRADPWDRHQNTLELDEILMDLMARNHR